MKQYLDLKVDLENPDEARHTIDELVKTYEEDKLKWTAEELAEAKHLAMQIMERLCLDGCDISWCEVERNHDLHSISVWLKVKNGVLKDGICIVSPALWNLWIAKCVCLCRATHQKVPDFIVKKAGECW
mgnify:CR=1 FL=1